MDEDPGQATTGLARVIQDAVGASRSGLFHVCGGEDDQRRFPAQFERDDRRDVLDRSSQDLLPRLDRATESQAMDAAMGSQGSPGFHAVSTDHVDHPWWKTNFC